VRQEFEAQTSHFTALRNRVAALEAEMSSLREGSSLARQRCESLESQLAAAEADRDRAAASVKSVRCGERYRGGHAAPASVTVLLRRCS
jgi:hypothetical protein